MKYLQKTFTVPTQQGQMTGTCEACVWGRGEHSLACMELAVTAYIDAFFLRAMEELRMRYFVSESILSDRRDAE